jgi:glycosyltransferase involved in cell wall biosynthesis
MRVLMLSKALVVGIYQRKLELLAERGVELLAVVPQSWRDERGEMLLERAYTAGYRLEALPLRRNGDYHLHSYAGLGGVMRAFAPQIVHIDEEPYNLAAWQAQFYAHRVGAKSLFFTWQNILRRYPPPFGWGERWILRAVDAAIAGTAGAAQVWRAKGYRGPLHIIPQFGVDEALFAPTHPGEPDGGRAERPFTIGFVGRLVEEKGVAVLLRALAGLPGEWCARLVGGGPLRAALEAQAQALGIAPRVTFLGQAESTQMPAQYRAFDVLALPSLTRPNWKEQFGRALVEAMACGVPVIGSDSGAIPDVIGQAGLIVPEGDAAALAAQLVRLRDDTVLRARLADMGRARVRAHFSGAGVADATVGAYRALLGE